MLATIGLLWQISAVFAFEAKLVGVYKDWSVYVSEEPQGKVCYMATKPQNKREKKLGESYAMITHRPFEGRLGEVSVVSGYTYKKDSIVKLKFKKKVFEFFTDIDTAWAKDSKADRAVASYLRAEAALTVEGINTKGEIITDSYSLKGSTAAYSMLNRACGL